MSIAGGPEDKPAFLNPERANAIGYIGEDVRPRFDGELDAEPDGDNGSTPCRGIIDRYREIARLHALGKRNNEICEILGYSQTRMSLILAKPFIQTEIARYRAKLFDGDVQAKIKEAALDGARYIHNVILDENAKESTRLDAAKWANEKVHGKARQEVNVESGTLSQFMEMLKEMRSRGESLEQPIDVTPALLTAAPADPPQADPVDTWIQANL